MAAAKVDHVRLEGADLGHQGVKVFFTAGKAFVQHFFRTPLRQRRAGGIGQPLTIGVFIVDDGDFLRLQHVQHIVGGDRPLLIVTTTHAEEIFHAALGDLRVGRAGGNGQDPGFVIYLGGRHR